MKTLRFTGPDLAALAAECDRELSDDLAPRWGNRADHAATAEELRATPGVWGMATTYRSVGSAQHHRDHARRGLNSYTPPGAFEAEVLPVGMGTGLFVRFVGDTG